MTSDPPRPELTCETLHCQLAPDNVGFSAQARRQVNRRWWLLSPITGILVVAFGARVVVATSDRDDLGISTPEILAYSFLGTLIFILGVFIWGAHRPAAGLSALRTSHPDSVVLPLLVQRENLDEFRLLTGAKLRGSPMFALFDGAGVRFWRGIRPREIAVLRWTDVDLESDRFTTPLGSWPCRVFRGAEARVKTVVFDEKSFWFPLTLNDGPMDELMRRLRRLQHQASL